ncbi:hypothetical protein AWV79_12285 [Cupriavidus sp. UYMMa02A]|nr:hypothetical protein AWV79_12285 [Cupriavidus sp. UYMMa02A]
MASWHGSRAEAGTKAFAITPFIGTGGAAGLGEATARMLAAAGRSSNWAVLRALRRRAKPQPP